MKNLFKLILVSSCILYTFGGGVTNSKMIYDLCYSDSKHCVKCSQNMSLNNIRYEKPFPQEEYRIQLMDQLNRVRSQYAEAHRISNMKFANWIKEFEALASDMSHYATKITDCTTLSGPSYDYKIIDFQEQIKLDYVKNLHKILRLQMENFTRQLLNSADMMAWNLNEFGCCYTFNKHGLYVSTLFRCVLYIENIPHIVALKSDKTCNDCVRASERCVNLQWYQGLCVPHVFNESRLKNYIEPDQHNVSHIKPIILGIVGVGSIIVVIACILYLVYKKMLGPKLREPKPVMVYDRASAPPYYL